MKLKLKNCIILAVIISIFLASMQFAGVFNNIQLKLADNLYGGKNVLDTIIIVAIDDNSLQEIGRWPWNRDVFANAINQMTQAKVIAIDVAFFEASSPEQDKQLGEAVSKANVIIPVEYTTFAKQGDKVIGQRLLLPIQGLENAKKGYINVVTDSDGVTRAVNTDISEEYDNFAYETYKEYWKKEINAKKSRFLVNFAGPPGSFKTYSITDVVNKRIESSEFENKLILIGATSPDLHDDYFVPTSKGKAMPGVEIHANTIQTMINKDFLQEESSLLNAIIIIIAALSAALIVAKFGIKGITIFSPLIVLVYILLSIYLFDKGIIMNLVYLPLTISSVYVAETIYAYRATKQEKQQIKEAFTKYVSAEVVSEVMKTPDKLQLGGARKEVTIFFSDIRGFTTLSEGLNPEKLVHLLNEYLSAMTDIIMKHQGLVDKYIGDAIMAFWGAPLEQENNAELACETSIEMQRKLAELNKKWALEKLPALKIGIGLNTGEAIIGNMGSYKRFDYTAIGDNINLGSRLEGLTKQYQVGILTSEITRKKAGDGFVFRKIDLVQVKGKTKPIWIYELICRKNEITNAIQEKIHNYEKGIELYLEKKWDKAITEFEKVNDFSSKEFINRCTAFKKTPPSLSWDGVWVMTSK